MTPARTCVFHPRFRIVRKALFSSGYSPPRFKARFPFTAGLFLAKRSKNLPLRGGFLIKIGERSVSPRRHVAYGAADLTELATASNVVASGRAKRAERESAAGNRFRTSTRKFSR